MAGTIVETKNVDLLRKRPDGNYTKHNPTTIASNVKTSDNKTVEERLKLATQAQAEAGTDNGSLMTPIRTKQHVDKRLLNNIIWRVNNGQPEWSNNNGGSWNTVGAVKSIQHGNADVTLGTPLNVTVASVNRLKTAVSIVSKNIRAYESAAVLSIFAELTSDTTLKITASGNMPTPNPVRWQLIEYY
ncbi:hypothetical protein [Paenibacillus sp. IITD108]|uniref:hypothetical protein n=1 Tax=Paenibacillus sp. IITD108 TaxID=3116649 RepID=UPI002F3E6F33